MIKILHTADLHLGSAFCGLSEDKAKIRQRELIACFDEMINIIKKESIELFIISGDLFDNSNCISTMEYVSAKLGEINNTKVFISAGNHDPKKNVYDLIKWSDNVHIFGGTLEKVEYQNYNIYGVSFLDRYQQETLLMDVEVDNSKVNILVIHGDIGKTEYNPIDVFALKKFDYSALGHIHKYSGIMKIENGYYAYPGIPAASGFDEVGDKGFLIGSIGKGKADLEFRKSNARDYIILDIDISKFDDSIQIVDYIKTLLKIDNLYKINLIGNVDYAVALGYIEDNIKDYCFYAKINDNTKEKIEYLKQANDYSLLGLFIKKMLMKIDQTDNIKEKEQLYKALDCGIKSLNGRSDLFD